MSKEEQNKHWLLAKSVRFIYEPAGTEVKVHISTQTGPRRGYIISQLITQNNFKRNVTFSDTDWIVRASFTWNTTPFRKVLNW